MYDILGKKLYDDIIGVLNAGRRDIFFFYEADKKCYRFFVIAGDKLQNIMSVFNDTKTISLVISKQIFKFNKKDDKWASYLWRECEKYAVENKNMYLTYQQAFAAMYVKQALGR